MLLYEYSNRLMSNIPRLAAPPKTWKQSLLLWCLWVLYDFQSQILPWFRNRVVRYYPHYQIRTYNRTMITLSYSLFFTKCFQHGHCWFQWLVQDITNFRREARCMMINDADGRWQIKWQMAESLRDRWAG